METLTIFTASLLGVVQGLTEFLPISSSGHLILAREALGIVDVLDLSFDALLHFATALAIVVYFRADIWRLVRAFFRLPSHFSSVLDTDERMAIALIVGTVPAVIAGLLLEDMLATAFRNPLLVAAALTVGSLVMLGAEAYSRTRDVRVDSVGIRTGVLIGLCQSLALVPGMSRSGMTISGGMLLGLSREFAAKFGFLLGVPILLGAGAKKALELGITDISASMLIGSATAFGVAIFVIHFLLRFLRTHTLHVFVAYRLVLAALVVLFVVV